MADYITGSNTYVAVGNKEDLNPVITNIAPSETPLYSAIGATSATATYHEWLEDDLGDAASNAKAEGFTYATTKPGTRERLGNYTQIMSRGYEVTDTQEVVQKHGLTSEMAYQMAKCAKLIAKDCEKAVMEQSTRSAGDNTQSTPTARSMGGIPYWVTTNVLDNSAVARDFTPDLLSDALEDCYDVGGSPSIAVMGGALKRTMSGWNGGAMKTIDADTSKITQKIDVYESDFGMLKVLLDRYTPSGKVYVLDPGLWKKATLRPFKNLDLPKTTDSIKKVIVGEWTLEARAEQANAIIADLQ